MGWLYLLLAGVIEVAMAYALKLSEGWSRPLPSVLAVLAATASIFWLTQALKHLPLGAAYAIWTGIGSVGVVLVGMFWLGEAASAFKLVCIALVVAGSMGLRLGEA